MEDQETLYYLIQYVSNHNRIGFVDVKIMYVVQNLLSLFFFFYILYKLINLKPFWYLNHN